VTDSETAYLAAVVRRGAGLLLVGPWTNFCFLPDITTVIM